MSGKVQLFSIADVGNRCRDVNLCGLKRRVKRACVLAMARPICNPTIMFITKISRKVLSRYGGI